MIINNMIGRKTTQKKILEELINNSSEFFTADEIYEKVKNKGIGIATVYRFLKELKYHTYICNKKIVYSKENNNHCHFICKICGKKNHFNLKNLDTISKVINGKICHLQLDITGICNDCLLKKLI
ncbi:MAG: transcriptional repressor [Candidatus Nanoarchaeia archaeon]|nr:transcriptional repressor [Candidatus Nanoarchaeia archaeon]